MTDIDPIAMLFWTAVLNGIVSVPIMAILMLLATNRAVMGGFVAKGRLKLLGWLATAVMAAAVLGMFLLL